MSLLDPQYKPQLPLESIRDAYRSQLREIFSGIIAFPSPELWGRYGGHRLAYLWACSSQPWLKPSGVSKISLELLPNGHMDVLIEGYPQMESYNLSIDETIDYLINTLKLEHLKY